jgi:hypothetical protein
MAMAGSILIYCNPQAPRRLQEISSAVRPDRWAILFGIFLWSVVLTHLFVFYLTRFMTVLLNLHGEETLADLWSPVVVGICESIMYPTALLIGKADFIGVWLAIKVAGQWARWMGEAGASQSPEELNEGRRRFNRFLVGNAASIIAGVLTWGAFKVWALF